MKEPSLSISQPHSTLILLLRYESYDLYRESNNLYRVMTFETYSPQPPQQRRNFSYTLEIPHSFLDTIFSHPANTYYECRIFPHRRSCAGCSRRVEMRDIYHSSNKWFELLKQSG